MWSVLVAETKRNLITRNWLGWTDKNKHLIILPLSVTRRVSFITLTPGPGGTCQTWSTCWPRPSCLAGNAAGGGGATDWCTAERRRCGGGGGGGGGRGAEEGWWRRRRCLAMTWTRTPPTWPLHCAPLPLVIEERILDTNAGKQLS